MGHSETLTFPLTISKQEAMRFAHKFDPLHVYGSNELIPENTVSGLLVVSLINHEMQTSDGWEGLLCATNIELQFLKPVCFDTEYKIIVHSFDRLCVKKQAGEVVRSLIRRESTVHVQENDVLFAVFKFGQYKGATE